jgi:hypothetical protein
VTKGTVTVSCSVVDAVSIAAPDDVGRTILGVKVASLDPEVVAVRIEVTWIQDNFPGASMPTRKQAAIALKNQSGLFGSVFLLSPSFDAKGTPSPTLLTAVTVQELKPSNSQAF